MIGALSPSSATRTVRLPMPHPGQREVRRQEQRFNWLSAGRRWRKTTFAMSVCVENALRGTPMLWGAPTYDQVRVAWEETRRAAHGAAQFNQTEMTARFPSGGTIRFRSLDDPDNARGHTAGGIVLDESGDVPQEAWYEVLRPMLIDTNGWGWIIGTPKGRNWFWREHQAARTREDSASWQIPTLGVEITPTGLVRAPHPLENPHIPFSEIAQLYATMPESTFRQEILAEFVDDATRAWLREWAVRFDAADAALSRLAIGRWLSYDTAFKDKDTSAYTACIVAELMPDYRLYVRHVWRNRLLFPNLMEAIHHDIQRWDFDEKLRGILIEDKASGTSAYQTLMASGTDRLRSILVPFQPAGSKEQRFDQAGVWVKNGSVLLPSPSPEVPWLLAFEEEVFEEGDFKDQRDAVAQLVIYTEHLLSEGLRARGSAPSVKEALAA